jgi:hypothetical protein
MQNLCRLDRARFINAEMKLPLLQPDFESENF